MPSIIKSPLLQHHIQGFYSGLEQIEGERKTIIREYKEEYVKEKLKRVDYEEKRVKEKIEFLKNIDKYLTLKAAKELKKAEEDGGCFSFYDALRKYPKLDEAKADWLPFLYLLDYIDFKISGKSSKFLMS